MGVNSRLRDIKPPLPAPTESMDEGGTASGFETDVATNLTTQTDKSSYEIPEDGKPITISTQKITSGGGKDGGAAATGALKGHHRNKSQTSLLIEYFEGSKKADQTRARPSVRVKVTPSARKKSGSGGAGGPDAVQITGIGKDRKPSYTRRISLGHNARNSGGQLPEGTEISHSSDSNTSSRPPIEVEVLEQNGSELSNQSRGLMYAPNESNVSSMPPDSMLEGGGGERSRSVDRDDDVTVKEEDYLQAPQRPRSRSASRDRITQRVMEKLGQTPPKARKSSKSLTEEGSGEGRRRSSKSQRYDEEAAVPGADSSVLSSNVTGKSYRSGSDVSRRSDMTNNPKLLGMVEDTIKRIILPEIDAIRADQKQGRRPSLYEEMYGRKGGAGVERSLSKSSSTPNISSRPKVVLNRDGEDPGTVLSRGDSERQKTRKSSQGSKTEERASSRRSSGSKSTTKARDTAAAGVAGGVLTAAALKSHDSRGDERSGRRKRNKHRSRSSGLQDSEDAAYLKEDIPPLPMASAIEDSEYTRDSLVSDNTQAPQSGGRTPASRGLDSPGTPSRGIGMSQNNQSIESPSSPYGNLSSKTRDRLAKLAAAGVGGAGAVLGAEQDNDQQVDADGYGGSPTTERKVSSPGVNSVSSLKKNFEEDALVPRELRPRSAASRSSAGRDSQASPVASPSSPSTKQARSRQQSRSAAAEGFGSPGLSREGTPGTPSYGEMEDWYQREHRLNDQYRDSLDVDSSLGGRGNRDSYQTNPYPQDEKRFSYFSEDRQGADPSFDGLDAEQDVRGGLAANPEYINTAHGAESAVASLMDPSTTTSSAKLSPRGSPNKANKNATFSARLRELGRDSPPIYQGSTLSETMPSEDRWQAIKGRARDLSGSRDDVREAGGGSSTKTRSVDEQPVMGASSLPVADDPIPEIGHFNDSKSDVTTNPSIIHGPLGGDATGKDPWPYTPEPNSAGQRGFSDKDDQSLKSDKGKGAGGLAAAAGGVMTVAAGHVARQATVEDEEDEQRALTPDTRRRGDYTERGATPTSPAAFRDEGYVTDAQNRSAGALTPRAEQQQYSRKDVDEFNRAMDRYDGEEDPFTGTAPQAPDMGGSNSRGVASPHYDSATGKGMENIQSKDIVALMDHLTVRDAQRNARDTEILVTLVRSAAEMRQNFDEMKRFIVEQDRMIMQSADRNADQTARKVLDSPRTPKAQSQSEEDVVQTKRKGVLRRALKGLTGGKSANDLSKVEGMLMQILDNVEDLKHQGVGAPQQRAPRESYSSETLETYERLRNEPDPGYEPSGRAGTSSTPSHSGQLSLNPKNEKHQYHSGYDGRRGSVNRVSTVMEGDEDEHLEPHEIHVLDNYDDGSLTPTQERHLARGFPPDSPYRAATYTGVDYTPLSPPDKQQKHKSNSSSGFGIPKISRWSKTTASSGVPDPNAVESPNMRNRKPMSDASRSGSTLNKFDGEEYNLREDDRLRSTQSLARDETRSMRSQSSKITRTPSPLIPSEASIGQDDDYFDVRDEPSPIQEDLDHGYNGFDDPKYQAHRNSLPLQHPQPRQGTTDRHQTTLESQAYQFDGASSQTSSDVSQRSVSDFDPATWGSSGTAGLAKHRLNNRLSPVSGGRYAKNDDDDDSLIPQKPPPPQQKAAAASEPEYDYEPQYSNSGFSRGGGGGGYYTSPFGSGHLLEPIEEVASITSSQASPEPLVASAKAVDLRSPARKITGPRPMVGSSSSSSPRSGQPRLVETGTVRRKPVGGLR